MASSSNLHNHILLPLLFIFVFNVPPCLSFDRPTEERVDKICRQMEDYGFCSRIFTQTIKTPYADFVQMNKVTLDQTNQNAASTHDFIIQLLANMTDVPTKNALVACENAYRVIQQAFQEANGDFNNGDYDSMVKSESVAPRAQSSCQVTFITPPSPVDPLKESNKQMRILIAMAVVTGYELLGQ